MATLPAKEQQIIEAHTGLIHRVVMGCRNKAKGITAPNHNTSFDIDEDCLPIGVQLQVLNTLKLLR